MLVHANYWNEIFLWCYVLKFLALFGRKPSPPVATLFGMGLFSLAIFIQNIYGSASEYSNSSS